MIPTTTFFPRPERSIHIPEYALIGVQSGSGTLAWPLDGQADVRDHVNLLSLVDGQKQAMKAWAALDGTDADLDERPGEVAVRATAITDQLYNPNLPTFLDVRLSQKADGSTSFATAENYYNHYKSDLELDERGQLRSLSVESGSKKLELTANPQGTLTWRVDS